MSTELDLGWLDPSLGAMQRQESGMGSGLCAAIAARMGVDVVLVRVAFALLALSGGLGVALYAWGTALTRSPTGVRPMDALLPAFARWTPTAQKAVVILTTLAAVSLVSSVSPLPWGPGVLLLALLVLARRGRLGGTWSPSATPQPQNTRVNTSAGAVSDDALVAHWRSQMHSATGRAHDGLPVVDLYAPEPPRAAPSGPRPKAAWLIGLGILVAMLATGAVTGVLLGAGPGLALGAALVAGGSLAVLYAVVARSKRVPRPLLGVLVIAMVAGGWLAPRAAESAVAPSADASVLTLTVVGEERVVDLGAENLDGIDEVRIEAIASDVTVLLPGPLLSLTSNEMFSDVSVETGNSTAAPVDFTVRVDATLSAVTLEERS
ncbi:PspC domain-containing protein [Tessaracoccus sp. MC1679]|uniref:PspC domain-containing protein n=1 Tax=Tessaracoccus sp. MC1679 TaxID=2760313 RepID=UPI0015FECE95|nr:PspC domain-containing protein [Tessaracoccus sp. MC1679]MBB1515425.1 PspC domain-containing protein [Tessaracoccus sp. MC1679]